jgi:hypothetical protein
MDFDVFIGTLGAVIAGNALTLLYVYALWRGTREERQNGDLRGLPNSVLFAGIAGPLIGGLSILYAVSW